MNAVSEKVDLNEVKRRQQQEIDDNCGAFGLPRGLKQDNRPKKVLSKEELLMQQKVKEI